MTFDQQTMNDILKRTIREDKKIVFKNLPPENVFLVRVPLE
jgi:hypothetical protein